MAQNLINLAYSEDCPNIFEENGSVIWQITLPEGVVIEDFSQSQYFNVETDGRYTSPYDVEEFQQFVQMLGLGDKFLDVLKDLPSFVTLRVKTTPDPSETSMDFLLVKHAYSADVNARQNGESEQTYTALCSLRPTLSQDYKDTIPIPAVCANIVVDGLYNHDGSGQINIFFSLSVIADE